MVDLVVKRIDDLNPTLSPQVDHEMHAQRAGLDVRLSVQQIIDLVGSSGGYALQSYVDALATGRDAKQHVRAASTANVSITSAPASIDGVTLANGDRVLLKNQTAPAENGIRVFTAAAAALNRAADSDTWDEIVNAYVWVSEGTVNADNAFVSTVNAGGTLNTTAITWSAFGTLGKTLRVDAAQTLTAAEQIQGRVNANAVGNLHKVTVVTASNAAFAFHAETKFVLVELGGGGAGGGDNVLMSSSAGAGGGGGAGGYVAKFFTTTGLTTAAIVIGGAGAHAGNGGNSSWTDAANTLTAGGGTAGGNGSSSSAGVTTDGGAGGTATGGDINVPGEPGENGWSGGTSSFTISWAACRSGRGGTHRFGQGGSSVGGQGSTSTTQAGVAAAGRCAGGSGSGASFNGAAQNGGAGTAGQCVVWEFR